MGSGTRRKSSDIIIITPKRKLVKGQASSSLSPSNERKCPSSFRVKLSAEIKLTDGMKLSVLQDKNIVVLYFGNTEVARLGTKKGQRIASCITAGFRYEGTVREKNGTKYAEVIRTN